MGKKLRVLITGISGTLGTAFAELLKDDYELRGIDRNESATAAFIAKYSIPVEVSDFESADLKGVDILIHLAALKHIDICETNTRSCVMNNVIRTYVLFERAREKGIKVLFMSTDKAVEPTSMYGFSKALVEGMCRENGWAFARSGNIVNSNGSIFTIWGKAIENDEPIRVTHPDMERYFISPENLAKRIWEAYLKGETEITPKMDRNASLSELYMEILEANNKPKDYPVEIIGLRPGEKMKEKLRWDE